MFIRKIRFLLLTIILIFMMSGCNSTDSVSNLTDAQTEESSTENDFVSADMNENENGTEEGLSEVTTTEITEETTESAEIVTVSLKDFVETPTIGGNPWHTWTEQTIYDHFGLNEGNDYYVSGEISFGDGTGIGTAIMGSSYTWFNHNTSKDEYISRVELSTRMDTGVSGTEITFLEDGNVNELITYIKTEAAGPYVSEDYELEWMEGHGKHMLDNGWKSIEDLLIMWGMAETDPAMLDAVNNFTEYSAEYMTEYGNAKFSIKYVEDTLFYMAYDALEVEFLDETSPYKSIFIEQARDIENDKAILGFIITVTKK